LLGGGTSGGSFDLSSLFGKKSEGQAMSATDMASSVGGYDNVMPIPKLDTSYLF